MSKYKPGDKIKIKTWKDMEKEYGLNEYGNIKYDLKSYGFVLEMERLIKIKYPDRVLTIRHVGNFYYYMMNSNYIWSDYMIECLSKDYIEPEPILTRWEILDIR